MLQIVGKAGIGTVLAAGLHDYSAEDLRLRGVLVEPDLHAVGECDFLYIKGIVLCVEAKARQQRSCDYD